MEGSGSWGPSAERWTIGRNRWTIEDSVGIGYILGLGQLSALDRHARHKQEAWGPRALLQSKVEFKPNQPVIASHRARREARLDRSVEFVQDA